MEIKKTGLVHTLRYFAAVAALALPACGQQPAGGSTSSATTAGHTTATPTSSGIGPRGSASATSTAKSTGESKPLSMEEYERLITALATCKTDQDDYSGFVAGDCPQYKTLQEATRQKDAYKDLKDVSPLVAKMLAHEAPAVRVYAADMTQSFFGVEGEDRKALVDAASKEKDPVVLKAIVYAVRNEGGRNAASGDLLLKLAAHENSAVRAAAAAAIGNSWNKDMKGAAPKLIELMEKDPDMKVRKLACSNAGDLGADELVPSYEKLTDSKADPELAAACFKGLVLMWANYPHYKQRSEKAYRLTLERLKQKPRSDKFPPWTVLGTFEHLGTVKGLDEWKAATSKWYDPTALRAALGEVIVDQNAERLARTSATKSVIALGATKSELEKWRKAYPDKPEKFGEKEVTDQLDKAISGAK